MRINVWLTQKNIYTFIWTVLRITAQCFLNSLQKCISIPPFSFLSWTPWESIDTRSYFNCQSTLAEHVHTYLPHVDFVFWKAKQSLLDFSNARSSVYFQVGTATYYVQTDYIQLPLLLLWEFNINMICIAASIYQFSSILCVSVAMEPYSAMLDNFL